MLVGAERPPSGDAEDFLRLLQVYRAEPAGSDTWVASGAAVYLPRGVYVVPPSTNGLLAPNVLWPTNPPLESTLTPVRDPRQPAGTPFADIASVLVLEFKTDGTPTLPNGEPHGRVVLATAVLNAGVPHFNNAAAVRGILIRPNGAISFANDASAF